MIPYPFPSCFRDHGAQPSLTNQALSTTKSPQNNNRSAQNRVTCLYRTAINGNCVVVSVTWCKSFFGRGLSVSLDFPACTQKYSINVKPWLFWKTPGSKSFDMGDTHIEMFWDFSSAKYAGSPEPYESFYVAIGSQKKPVVLLGDMHKEALSNFQLQAPPPESVLLSRKEYLYGKEVYTTKARLCEQGRSHDIAIECHVSADSDSSCLSVRVDKQTVIHVTSLMWKFRGNQTIQIDGAAVDVFWDVHNWLFKGEETHAVFMFHACSLQEKPWRSEVEGQFCSQRDVPMMSISKPHCISDSMWASVLQWPTQEKEQSFSLLVICLEP